VTLGDAGEYWCVEDEGFGAKHVTNLYVTGNILLLLIIIIIIITLTISIAP